jgi:hypothetical protein
VSQRDAGDQVGGGQGKDVSRPIGDRSPGPGVQAPVLGDSGRILLLVRSRDGCPRPRAARSVGAGIRLRFLADELAHQRLQPRS